MIIGGTVTSRSSKKTYLRMVQNVLLISIVPKIARINNPVIRFSEEDARRLYHLHEDALVVSL